MAQHRAPRVEKEPHPGDALLRTGVVLFLVGVVAIVATVVPQPFQPQNRPLWLNLLAFVCPLGLGLAIAGGVVGARASRAAERRRSRG